MHEACAVEKILEAATMFLLHEHRWMLRFLPLVTMHRRIPHPVLQQNTSRSCFFLAKCLSLTTAEFRVSVLSGLFLWKKVLVRRVLIMSTFRKMRQSAVSIWVFRRSTTSNRYFFIVQQINELFRLVHELVMSKDIHCLAVSSVRIRSQTVECSNGYALGGRKCR